MVSKKLGTIEQFADFVYDGNGKIAGALLQKNGKPHTVAAKLVVDASGIASAARSRLKDGYGVENFQVADHEKFYVVLRYVKLKHPERDRVTRPCGWPAYKAWIAPQHDPDGAIIGIGLILLRNHHQGKPIPFGPYLAIAGWIALLWGDNITRWYLDIVL